ncbi:CUB and sushi domain-containing protein 3-like isoform X2 [Sycon ciliatum]|uniref:CUB and sushi domain-containing protein 3-like isoform X2 n=1 Tax=Sycon ciliatum TaxID=27933 RepID=UPI0031F63F2C
MHPINCTGQGYPEPTVTLMVDNVVMIRSYSNSCTGGVCTKTHTASLDGSNFTPGHTINITCTVDINQPPFTCTAAQNSTLQTQCNAAAKSRSQTRMLTVVAQCPHLDDLGFNYKPITGFSRTFGTNISIQCRTGYLSTNALGTTTTTCQSGGVWSPSPPGCENCSIRCADDNKVVACNHVMGTLAVNCVCPTNYTWTGSKCALTHCEAVNQSSVSYIGRSPVGQIITVKCRGGYSNKLGPITAKCGPQGIWSELPHCQVTHCEAVNQSTASYIERSPVGQIITVKCRSGYSNKLGPATAKCGPQGNWSELPHCQAQISGQMSDATQGITIGVFIGSLAASLLLGALIMFLFAQFVQRKRRSTQQDTNRMEIGPETPTRATPNMAYEDAEIVETTLTSSEAYGVAGTADPHNYEFVRP